MSSEDLVVRPVELADAPGWAELYRGYRAFYELEPDDDVIERVWGWVIDPAHEVNSFVACSPAGIIGLANYRRFARPSSGTVGIYLDDLFTAPEARGTGAGRALLRELSELAAREGRSVVRWITAADNHRARRLYDSAANVTPWVTYDLKPGSL